MHSKTSASALALLMLSVPPMGCNGSTIPQGSIASFDTAHDGGSSPGDGGSPLADATSSPVDATSSATDATSSHVDAGSTSAQPSPDAGVSRGWAMWPMPNPPTSGLPHPQSYDTSVPGTALDRVTGLTWQREATVLSTAQWTDATTLRDQATASCAGLSLAGYTDWRVPSRIELASLLDFRTNPAIDSAVFGTTAAFYVSSSVHGLGTTVAIAGEIWFGNGTNTSAGIVLYANIAPELQDAGQLQGPLAVRCVRGHGNATGPHYTVAGGTAHDNWTGLTWMQAPSPQVILPSTVGSYCASLTAEGGGWRAPSVNEIETVFGDLSTPDGVAMDSAAFPDAGSAPFGTVDSDLSLATDGGPIQWINVSGGGTDVQEDIVYLSPPLPGGAPMTSYWVNALCVR